MLKKRDMQKRISFCLKEGRLGRTVVEIYSVTHNVVLVAGGWMGGGAMRGLPRQSGKDSEAFSFFFELSKSTLSIL